MYSKYVSLNKCRDKLFFMVLPYLKLQITDSDEASDLPGIEQGMPSSSEDGKCIGNCS